MSAIEKVFVLNLESEVMRAGLTVGNLLTQKTPPEIIQLYPARDGRGIPVQDVIQRATDDGFSSFAEYQVALKTWVTPPTAIELAIRWSYLSIFRTIRDEVKTCALFLLDDCMLSETFWNVDQVAAALTHFQGYPLKLCQLGRWEPCTYLFDKPKPLITPETTQWTRITRSLAFGDYGTLITPAGAVVLLEAMLSRLDWQMERHIVELEGPGVYSLYPPIIEHEWYKEHWTQNSR